MLRIQHSTVCRALTKFPDWWSKKKSYECTRPKCTFKLDFLSKHPYSLHIECHTLIFNLSDFIQTQTPTRRVYTWRIKQKTEKKKSNKSLRNQRALYLAHSVWLIECIFFLFFCFNMCVSGFVGGPLIIDPTMWMCVRMYLWFVSAKSLRCMSAPEEIMENYFNLAAADDWVTSCKKKV